MDPDHTHQSSVEGTLEPTLQSTREHMPLSADGLQCLAESRGDAPSGTLGLPDFRMRETTSDGACKFGDVKLLRNRQFRFNQRERRQLELLCEEKVSKHKLEEVHCSLPSLIKSTFIMTFSPDGQRVASTHGDHRIYICDLNTGKLLDTLEGHPKTPWCLAWHPSNRDILASGCLAGEVRVWDLRSKACESWTSENHTIISSLDFHPKERVLAIATANDLLFWDWSESEPFAKTTTLHDREKVKFVVFDSSGTKLITGISNLPKYAGYNSDSLQNRIIDGYLSQGPIETLPTENMTHNSEISTSPASGTANNINPNHAEQNASPTQSTRPNPEVVSNGPVYETEANTQNNGQDVNYRNTLLLSRVASLYRQLESLEDSMRHTSFTPVMNLRPADNPSSAPENTRDDRANASSNDHQPASGVGFDSPSDNRPDAQLHGPNQNPPPTDEVSSQHRHDSSQTPTSSITPANTFEPYLVTFDEFLEQLQLPTLIMDGRPVDLATVIDQYPVDLTRQVHHAMQFESINQVNQNFIRISKLMSSARLYRQVVQQIMAYSAGNRPMQPNQMLTAQSVSPRSPRNSPNIPVMLRNYSLAVSLASGGGLTRHNRSHDPIMAIEIQNSARNVPLTTICQIDLLAARTICIQRSQTLVDQAIANTRHLTTDAEIPQGDAAQSSPNNARTDSTNTAETRLQKVLTNLHNVLSFINHTQLTTSNAYAHITNLRIVLGNLYSLLSATLRSPADGNRLGELMQIIATSLTGRRESAPLGATLNELRLDIIHTLCIADLTLHLVRQVQLLQMTRVSLISRVEESRRSNIGVQSPAADNMSTEHNVASTHNNQAPSPSDSQTARPLSGASKRKSSEPKCEPKRLRTGTSQPNNNPDSPMDTSHDAPASSLVAHSSPTQGSPSDRMVIWNSLQNSQVMEQNLQRFLAATASSMNTSHILVRVYHRIHGMPAGFPAIVDPIIERAIPQQAESRRRALSQDTSAEQQDSIEVSVNSLNVVPTQARYRVRPPTAYPINMRGSTNANNPFDREAWHRQPWYPPTRAPGQHLWFNQWTIPLPINYSNFRLQCWNFSRSLVPNIKDSQVNVITHKCRILNDSSVDLSSDGGLLACLVPRDDNHTCFPGFELKIFSLKSHDFGTCLYKVVQGHNALSVSLSPSGNYAVVGLATQHKSFSYDQNEDSLKIGKVFKLSSGNSIEPVRDIKIKRDDSSFCLTAIKWMPRGIVYSVGPQHMQRYQTARMRNVVAS